MVEKKKKKKKCQAIAPKTKVYRILNELKTGNWKMGIPIRFALGINSTFNFLNLV